MRMRLCTIALMPILVFAATAPRAADPPAATDATDAFEQLKSLAGTWNASIGDPLQGEEYKAVFRVSSAGKSVIETQFTGTTHEMTTIYYLSGGELHATHYCSLGNQPAYRYAPGAGNDVAFAFVGGTGFDPAVDRHARDVSFTFKDADHVETLWRFFGEGREETRAKSFLTRQKT